MALEKKAQGAQTSVDPDFPDIPVLFAREPDRQQIFEAWVLQFQKSLLLKFGGVTSKLDKKADKV